MEIATVYFADFRTKAFGEGLPTNLKKLIKKSEDRADRYGCGCIHQLDPFQGP